MAHPAKDDFSFTTFLLTHPCETTRKIHCFALVWVISWEFIVWVISWELDPDLAFLGHSCPLLCKIVWLWGSKMSLFQNLDFFLKFFNNRHSCKNTLVKSVVKHYDHINWFLILLKPSILAPLNVWYKYNIPEIEK